MHAWEKRIMRLGALLLGVGALLFAGVLALNGFNFDSFAQAASYKRVTHAPEGEFDRLEVSAVEADVHLQIAEDNICRVVCDESGRGAYTVEVRDGTLVVRLESRWYDSIGIHLGEPELTLYLPERDYAQVQIHSVSGDVDVGGLRIGELSVDTTSGGIELEKLELGSLDAESVSGDIEMQDSAASGEARIRTTSGGVDLENADAAGFEISTVSGDVKGTLRNGKLFDVQTVSGDVKLPQSASGGTFRASTTSGDVEIEVK